jgi:hypothetical protein
MEDEKAERAHRCQQVWEPGDHWDYAGGRIKGEGTEGEIKLAGPIGWSM